MLQNSTNSFDEDKSRHSMLVAGEGKLKENRQREREKREGEEPRDKLLWGI